MECENCGLIADHTAIQKRGYCPFCDTEYPVIVPVDYVVIPTPERARELRDLCTDVMTMLIQYPLSTIDSDLVEIERWLYQTMKEDAEMYDEIAGDS